MELKPYVRAAHYYETDQMGVVHHSNYIRWFEEARLYIIGQCGLGYHEIEHRGVMIPVLDVSCAYKKPVRFGDTVVIEMRIVDFQKSHGIRYGVEYRIIDAETGDLLTTGASHHCLTDMNLRPIRCQREQPDIYEVFKMMEEKGWVTDHGQ